MKQIRSKLECYLAPFVLSLSKHIRGLSFDKLRTNGPCRLSIYSFILINTFTVHGLTIIRGDETSFPYGFSTPINTAVLQESTGTYFVGIDFPGSTSTTNPIFSIAKAFRPTFFSTPQFIGIATNTAAQARIKFLTVSDQNKCNTVLPFVIRGGIDFTTTQVSAIFDDGSGFGQTIDLNDANGRTTGGIVQLATSNDINNKTNIFAAVKPNVGDFGNPNSGIALMSFVCTGTNIILNTLDATNGTIGNLAEELDLTSTQLKGANGDVIFSTDPQDINKIAFFYDDLFERLYIGVRIETGAQAGDIGKSIVVGYVDDNGALVLNPIAPDSVIDPAINQIILAQNTANQAGPNLRANHLGVMHTSAGPSYLIVQGGIGTTNQVGNLVFALPLVDDPSDPTIHGTLADKDAELEDFRFVDPATLPDEVAFVTDAAARVGNGPLPIPPAIQISDMVVSGDAVYVSIAQEPSAVNDSGILYSQALFDAEGKIIGWTDWVNRASPINLFPQVGPGSGVDFFAVDATTGNIYIVRNAFDNATENLVGITSWTKKTLSDFSLINMLNRALSEGSYSMLDLPQNVRGFTGVGAPTSRYALFGGVNKVVFARISEAANTDISSPQETITNFNSPENFFVSPLSPDSGCVQVLEYSRRTAQEGNTGYFFAGTEKGLFVFAQEEGEGFDVSDLDTLDEDPFTTGRWVKIPQIKGSVIDIKTSGRALYILTFETSAETPLKNTLYRVPFEDSIEEMFHNFMNLRIIAQTGTEPALEDTQLFTGIQIIATGDSVDSGIAANKEQLILATNQGLYKSNADQMGTKLGIITADDQDEAHWELIDETEDIMYTGISGIETPIRHTTWPISVQDNVCTSFDASSIEQLSGNGDSGGNTTGEVGFAPFFFNAEVDTPAFNALLPITYFFSDGGRRFFIVNPTGASSIETKLSVIPFDTLMWDLTSPHVLNYPALQSVQRFFWVHTIGMSGLVLAGTNNGVIGLT